jgi:sodium/hydrogen exchanger-like protein 6/7
MMINAVCRALGKPDQLPRNHQMMLFWAGLRGAVAFALASGITGDSAPAMRTTILAVVVLTVLLFGGTTSRMLQVLDIRTGVIEPEDSSSENEQEDQEETGGGNSGSYYYQRVGQSSSQQHYLDQEDEEDEDLMESGQRRRARRDNDVSIGGLLSGPLGEPIPEDRPPHWFVSFDEKWLKPFLTKKHIQQRNQTLAEYWREKRRKMERANISMLAGIRGMEDDYDDSDALTLKTVNGLNRVNSTASSSRSSNNASTNSNTNNNPKTSISSNKSSRIIIGSGRVFGRSPSIASDED